MTRNIGLPVKELKKKPVENEKNNPLPVTDSVFPELMTLPLHPDVSEQDVDYIAAEIKRIIES